MSMSERSRDVRLTTRSSRRQDPEVAALRARGHSLLAANWRMRIRGDGRPPARPLGEQLTAPSLNGDGDLADVDYRNPTNGTALRLRMPSQNGGPKIPETGVLVFPRIVPPPPEKPVRGPLSWAYWSARRK